MMTLEEERVVFYHTLGHAMGQWAFVEMGLTRVAVGATKPETHALSVAFVSIENFRSKLAFVDNAMKEPQNLARYDEDWRPLHDELKALSVKRNQLVHWQVVEYDRANQGRRVTLERRLLPPEGLGRQPPQENLAVRDVDLVSRQFSRIAARLHVLENRMADREALFARHAQRDLRHRPLTEIARQIRAALELRE